QLADGIVAMQQSSGAVYPGAFLSWKNRWHGWANAQSQALAQLGVILQQPELVAAARFEADHYSPLLLTRGMLREWNPLHLEESREFEQIAYDIRPLALGLLEVAIATGDTNYAVLAGLAGSWLFGNNAAGEQMYDPKTGRCFDGINDSLKINMNSGAESTIEALYTLVKLEQHPVAARYLNFMSKTHGILDSEAQTTSYYRVFSGPDHKQITLVTHWQGHAFHILPGDACQLKENNSKNRLIHKVRPVK
ncbi:hypothetical protein KAH55_13410, partial [bacterium]|nr:hypothetical protein [bacterium]